MKCTIKLVKPKCDTDIKIIHPLNAVDEILNSNITRQSLAILPVGGMTQNVSTFLATCIIHLNILTSPTSQSLTSRHQNSNYELIASVLLVLSWETFANTNLEALVRGNLVLGL